MVEDKSLVEERWTFADLVSGWSVPVDEWDLPTKSGDRVQLRLRLLVQACIVSSQNCRRVVCFRMEIRDVPGAVPLC